MQITSNQNSFPVVDALAGSHLAIVTEQPVATVASPSLEDLPPAVDLKGLGDRVKLANDALQSGDQSLSFRVHDANGETKVQLVDTSNQQVLREFPAQNFVQMIDKFQNVAGLNVNVRT